MGNLNKKILALIVMSGLSSITFAADLIPVSPDSSSLTWINLPTLPGTQYAMLAGNPAKKELFVVRLKFPANYNIQPHYHNITEYDTVISGAFYLGNGKKFEADNGIALTPGSYITIPAKTIHYGWTKEETVLQITGIGPWGAIYMDEHKKS
jgi:quercetin dioxygenase-like cupin family protein